MTSNASELERARLEITAAFPEFGIRPLLLNWILVATWLNVTDFPDNADLRTKQKQAAAGSLTDQGNQRNTFQAMLATDGRHSFALFNYENITWATGGAILCIFINLISKFQMKVRLVASVDWEVCSVFSQKVCM